MPLDAAKRRCVRRDFRAGHRRGRAEISRLADVPIDATQCGEIARQALPAIRQIFIGRSAELTDEEAVERKLYVIRKRVTSEGAKIAPR